MRRIVRGSVDWKVDAIDPPILTRSEWIICNLLGAVFITMALLQLISFNDFRGILETLGIASPTSWAVAVIFAEILAAIGLFKLRLSYLFRVVSGGAALLVSGFWLVLITQAVSSGREAMPSSGLFGGYLNQSPGWWTVVEATMLVFWAIYAVALTRYTIVMLRPKVK